VPAKEMEKFLQMKMTPKSTLKEEGEEARGQDIEAGRPKEGGVV
jgi:hypothetical protein